MMISSIHVIDSYELLWIGAHLKIPQKYLRASKTVAVSVMVMVEANAIVIAKIIQFVADPGKEPPSHQDGAKTFHG